MTAVIACVPLFAGALAAQTSTNGRLPGEGGQGVKVMLLAPSPQTHEPLRYVLSEPAYVAAFMVYPGAGVQLLYPLVNTSERLHRAGYNTEPLIGASFDNDIYRVVLGPRLPGPAYLYVIASRHPLDVARYVHRPMRLAAAVGERESRSFYTDVAVDALLNNAVALGDDMSWDADVFMLWPNGGSPTNFADATTPGGLPAVRYIYLACADGSTRVVPDNYPFIGCPGQPHVRPSDRGPRQVQQSASAAAPLSTQVQPAGSATGVATAPPTVLPTIIGPHITNAERRAAIQQEALSQRVMFTAANGDSQVAQQPAEAAPATQLQVIESAARIRNGVGRDRDGVRGQRSAEQREEQREEQRQREQNRGIAGSPQLAPNPQLSPNPVLAPAPRLAPNPAQSGAPRMEHPQREFRNEQRAAPREMPRFEPPRMTPATAIPSVQGVPAQTPGQERPGRIQ